MRDIVPRPDRRSAALPVASVLVAMSSYQLGAALAKGLFSTIGAEGTTAWRLGLAALVLAVLWRPWRMRLRGAQWRAIFGYGLALGGLNLCFYMALRTIPLGVTVAIEFVGPLVVAALFSHRRTDLVWVLLAAVGVLLLVPLNATGPALDPVGLGYAGLAAVLWGGYIVLGREAGRGLRGGQVTASGVMVAAFAVAPFAAFEGHGNLLDPRILPLAGAVAVLSSALPNTLEMLAMTRLPTRVFGVLMSFEPALGALFGLILLGERLTLAQWGGIAAVMLASAGITLTAGRDVG